MFERFTQEAKAVLVQAETVAVELGAGYISPGHILYGCAAGRESTAGEPLRMCGITDESIRLSLPRAEETAGGEIDEDALRAIGVDDGGRARCGRADLRRGCP